MNKIAAISLLSLVLSAPSYAVCVDTNVSIQIDIHAQSGGNSQQQAQSTQQQDENCFNNRNTTVTQQLHVGADAANQNIVSNSQQSTPKDQNPLAGLGIKVKNIATNVSIQREIVLPDAAFRAQAAY
jgi:hypothetical protein